MNDPRPIDPNTGRPIERRAVPTPPGTTVHQALEKVTSEVVLPAVESVAPAVMQTMTPVIKEETKGAVKEEMGKKNIQNLSLYAVAVALFSGMGFFFIDEQRENNRFAREREAERDQREADQRNDHNRREDSRRMEDWKRWDAIVAEMRAANEVLKAGQLRMDAGQTEMRLWGQYIKKVALEFEEIKKYLQMKLKEDKKDVGLPKSPSIRPGVDQQHGIFSSNGSDYHGWDRVRYWIGVRE